MDAEKEILTVVVPTIGTTDQVANEGLHLGQQGREVHLLPLEELVVARVQPREPELPNMLTL